MADGKDSKDSKMTDGKDCRNSKAADGSPQTTRHIPWMERYRPRTMDDVVGHGETIERLRVIPKVGNMPNLLFVGPPGVGKTTSALCLARELLGDDYGKAVLELNASMDVHLSTVREQIKMFVKQKTTVPHGRHKIVILDEADALSFSAQKALCRITEIYAHTTRFIFTCNLSSKIIEPIQSRCAVMRLDPLDDVSVVKRLKVVLATDHTDKIVDEEALEITAYVAEGDMRRALNVMEMACGMGSKVTRDRILAMAQVPDPLLFAAMLKNAMDGQIDKAAHSMSEMWKRGHLASELCNGLVRAAKAVDLEAKRHMLLMKIMAPLIVFVSEQRGSLMQFTGVLARVTNTFHAPFHAPSETIGKGAVNALKNMVAW